MKGVWVSLYPGWLRIGRQQLLLSFKINFKSSLHSCTKCNIFVTSFVFPYCELNLPMLCLRPLRTFINVTQIFSVNYGQLIETALECYIEKDSEAKSSFIGKEHCCQLAMPHFNHWNLACWRQDNREDIQEEQTSAFCSITYSRI